MKNLPVVAGLAAGLACAEPSSSASPAAAPGNAPSSRPAGGPDAALPPPVSVGPPLSAADDVKNLIVFNRGLVLPQVVDNVRVEAGSAVWVVDPDVAGSERRVVDPAGAADLMPAWRGDKRRVVFASTRGRDHGADRSPFLNLWTVGTDGQGLARLTTTEGHDWTPAWSRDGRHVAFASTRGKDDLDSVWGFDVYVVEAEGGTPRLLYGGPGQDEDPVFSADGRTVYFNTAQEGGACLYQIWQVDLAGGPSTAKPVKDAAGASLCGEDPSVSPDGRRLFVFTSGALRSVDLETHQVTTHGAIEEPWIGPDGRRVVAMRDLKFVHIAALDGSGDRRVTTSGDDFFPRWTP